MEIGPITGVRSVSLLSMHRAENSQPPIFEIDPASRAGDETYSGAGQTPNRGLEDEDSGAPEEEDSEPAVSPIPPGPSGGINYFA